MKISIVVPVYNSGKYLKRCVDSIIGQTLKEWELCLVDDGSVDNSPDICDSYSRQDDRIHVIHQDNAGHTAARNAGLAASGGEYVIFIDSDDYLDKEMLGTLYSAAAENSADVVQCGYFADQNEWIISAETEYPDGIYDVKKLKSEIYPTMICKRTAPYAFGIAPNMWNKLFRNELAKRFLPNININIKSGEDGLFTFQCMMAAKRFVNINRCLYHYCSNEGSVSRNIGADRIRENHQLFGEYENLWGCNDMLMKQVYHYVVYQTLQAVDSELAGKSWNAVKKECRESWGKDPIERRSIKAVEAKEIKGKRNQLILLWMKTW